MNQPSIEFYYIESGKAISKNDSNGWLFVYCDKVFADTFESCESQSARVSLDDFMVEKKDIGWRVKE